LKRLKESAYFLLSPFYRYLFHRIEYDPEFSVGDHMFNDLALSREAMREYHAKLDRESPAQKLSVMVLQRSVWPFAARKTDIDLPPSVGRFHIYISFVPGLTGPNRCKLS
jgi:hypothetical protein